MGYIIFDVPPTKIEMRSSLPPPLTKCTALSVVILGVLKGFAYEKQLASDSCGSDSGDEGLLFCFFFEDFFVSSFLKISCLSYCINVSYSSSSSVDTYLCDS